MSDDVFVLEEPANKTGDGEAGSNWTPIEDDTVLEATVLGIQRVTKPFNDDKGKPVEKMQFEFEISEDSEFKGRKIKGETSTNFTNHPNCRMRNWVQEILATELPAGFRFNPEAVRGSSVRIVVGKKVKPRRDGGGDWIDNSVKDVWRQKAAAAKSDDSLEQFGAEPF